LSVLSEVLDTRTDSETNRQELTHYFREIEDNVSFINTLSTSLKIESFQHINFVYVAYDQ